MKLIIRWMIVGIVLGGGMAHACIQTMRMEEPRNSSQLPADLFKLPVHITPEPLAVDMLLLNGKVITTLGSKPALDAQTEYLEVIKRYESNPATHNAFEERNDYAAALLFAGRYSDAVPVLIDLEKDYPGKYSTASNLGTAYELTGDLEGATKWIQLGMERNPESHFGTEWLHLAVLNAKKQLRTHPDWLNWHSVLDGQKARPKAEVEQALEYQLNERLYFIRNDDDVMCDLFYQAAVLTEDHAKREYFLRQVPRFGKIRDYKVEQLKKGKS